jgi:large subunit ribosomal protein L22
LAWVTAADEYLKKNMEARAILRNVPTSPRKMRLVADMIRGQKVSKALAILKFQPQAASFTLHKVLLSAVANWQQSNEDAKIEDTDLVVKTIFVDGGRMLKRLRPAPQGRAHRIRKRSNHITIVIDDAAGNAVYADSDENNTES